MKPSASLSRSLLLLALAAPVWAQESDPQWRVISAAPAEVVPLYDGKPTPFPTAREEKQEDVSAAELERQQALALIAQAKSEIEGMFKSATVFLPDVSGLGVQAYMKGGKGNMALIASRWYPENTFFSVPSYKNPAILSKINSLKTLDSMTADTLSQQLDMQHGLNPSIKLQIVSINSKQAVFKGPAGNLTLPIRQNNL